ncbi:MAG TPA: ATP-binding protein [Verrucomicrobiae bacterium]|jgi:signal transduction histidine kinase/ActR/RegA family two-component response regulator
MSELCSSETKPNEAIAVRTDELFREQHQSVIKHADRLFGRLMIFQWLFGVALAIWISPKTWIGSESRIHLHLWAAVVLGGVISTVPVLLTHFQSGKPVTRQAVAIGQMLMSALLIHLTGGRIETHFHVFGSLAILAFYRDWKVLISASAVVYVDHLLRGIFWPQSVYGVLNASIWRSFEHAGWVVFELMFLLLSIRQGLGEMRLVAERQAKLEAINEDIEKTVAERTDDLTRETAERRQAQERLRQSQKMEAIGRLAGGVAHDFNNLLTVIGGYCALAMPSLGETDPLQRNLTEIYKAAERARGLTGQLLAFSRKQVLQPRVLNLCEVIQGMEKMLRRLVGEDIEFLTAYAVNIRHVKADPGQIEQVIMNLVVNARDAMPRGGKLTISVSNAFVDQDTMFRNRALNAGRYVLISVTDTGLGMTEEVKSHLFEPFFTTKGVGKGTGLGLATCYGIVCQSGGDIRVYSEQNSGTAFKIYLPCTDAMPERMEDAEFGRLPRGKESILVVEDETSLRNLAVFILKGQGYQVQESCNAFEAMELLRKDPSFDLVMTDVIMPQMSGKVLCDQIKSQIPHIRVLLMSGYTDDALAHHGVLDEGLSFLEKPFSPMQLTKKVREVLDSPNGAPVRAPRETVTSVAC